MQHAVGSTCAGPSTAERVRTACARASAAALAIDGCDPVATSVHHLRRDGAVIVGVPNDSAAVALTWQASASGLPAMLEFTDLSPLRLREPVRSLAWLSGTLHAIDAEHVRAVAADVAEEHPNPALLDVGHSSTLLRLELASAVSADTSGAEPVPVQDLVSCQPDPFWEMEPMWLAHLDSKHSELLEHIAQRLPLSLRGGKIRPLALDRFGLTLRIERCPHDDAGDKDVRVGFAAPVSDAAELSRALRILVGCPFLNGLRARHR
jgi:hypothetical protein